MVSGESTADGGPGAAAVPRARGEWARHWRYDALPGLDLLRARYVRHSFPATRTTAMWSAR